MESGLGDAITGGGLSDELMQATFSGLQDQRRRRPRAEGFQCGEKIEKDDALTFVSEYHLFGLDRDGCGVLSIVKISSLFYILTTIISASPPSPWCCKKYRFLLQSAASVVVNIIIIIIIIVPYKIGISMSRFLLRCIGGRRRGGRAGGGGLLRGSELF